MKHELTADERQLDNIRDELHTHLDYIINHIPGVQRMRSDMARGYPSATLGDPSGGGPTDAPQADPAAWARDALNQWQETIGHIRNTASRIRRLQPLTPQQVQALEERQQDADIPQCGLCDLPAPDKIRRIDGVPFHADTCYYKVWRAGRTA